MTLKNKQNHYNVKLLRGYGVSINLKDNKMWDYFKNHEKIGRPKRSKRKRGRPIDEGL